MTETPASNEARNFEVPAFSRMMNPSWSGHEVIVYHMTREAMQNGDVMPFFSPKSGAVLNLINYEQVAKIEYKWVVAGHCTPPFGVTQNAFDSWSKDRDGVEQDCHTLSVLKPLRDGWGHRSTSVGDLIEDVSTGRFYVVDDCGYSRLIPVMD
jgi:hypothetical protein